MDKEKLIKLAEDLYQSAFGANAYYAIMMQYREMSKKYNNEMNLSPAFYGMWQFLCGKAHETDEAKLVSLKSVFDLDNSVGILKDMPCGYYAERKAQDDEWSVRKR